MGSIRFRVWAGFVVGLVGVAGCNRESPTPAVAVAAAEPKAETPIPPPPPVVTPPVPQVPVAVQTPPPQPPAPPPVFPFPTDTAGKELPKVVAPRPPAPPPLEKYGTAPKDRTPPARVVNPDPLGKLAYAPPPALPNRPAGFSPHAPLERVPFELGIGAADVPARPAFAVSKTDPVVAKNVADPPPLATLGKQVTDRASLDDPSAEPAGVVLVNRTVTPALSRADFLRITLPDPFELSSQVRLVVPPVADPGLTPVLVSPMRPK